MSEQLDFQDLTRQAQQGDKQALDRLAELAVTPLRVYVYRLTLQEDLTQEIVQETLLEMVKIIGKLQKADRFLPWLYGIATNKLRHFYRSEATLRRASANKMEKDPSPSHHREDGLENLLSQELKDIITAAISGLKTRYKAVLVMRCYDGMTYAEIAESMGTTEFGTRMLFIRAKKALQKKLAQDGLGKGALLAVLALFGKMTAPSEAAASQIVVTAATTNAGVLAGAAALATSKAAIVAVTAGALGVGTAVVDPFDMMPDLDDVNTHFISSYAANDTNEDDLQKHWYYMPNGVDGPLMMRSESNTGHNAYNWVVVQDDEHNYYYDGRSVHINNHRAWSEKTLRLATDTPAMAWFLTKMDSYEVPFELINAKGRDVFVSAIEHEDGSLIHPTVEHRGMVLDEPFFLADWPSSARFVDHRDAMHKRGWTYFEVDGQIQGQSVAGYGRIPFVYDAFQGNRPYLSLRIGSLDLVDTVSGASVANRRTGQSYRLTGGNLFQGLGRPWMGMHTLDCIRRDAASVRVPFTTAISEDQKFATVSLDLQNLTLEYKIDLDNDLLIQIDMVKNEDTIGYLTFNYLQEWTQANRFNVPRARSQGSLRRDLNGLAWLDSLARLSFFKD